MWYGFFFFTKVYFWLLRVWYWFHFDSLTLKVFILVPYVCLGFKRLLSSKSVNGWAAKWLSGTLQYWQDNFILNTHTHTSIGVGYGGMRGFGDCGLGLALNLSVPMRNENSINLIGLHFNCDWKAILNVEIFYGSCKDGCVRSSQVVCMILEDHCFKSTHFCLASCFLDSSLAQ